MKFSVQKLLGLPVLFLAITFLKMWNRPLASTPYGRELNSIPSVQRRLELSIDFCGYSDFAVDFATVDKWISHELPSDHPASSIMLDPPPLDSWGHPYRIRSLESNLWESCVYSTGEDGISKTGGNDPDDIRSWDDIPLSWYYKRAYQRELKASMLFSAIVTPICLLAFNLVDHIRVNKRVK